VILPPADLFTAILKPLGVKRNASRKFPEYGWTIEYCNSMKLSAIQESNMAASKPETLLF
jgi:hypothetical protein